MIDGANRLAHGAIGTQITKCVGQIPLERAPEVPGTLITFTTRFWMLQQPLRPSLAAVGIELYRLVQT